MRSSTDKTKRSSRNACIAARGIVPPAAALAVLLIGLFLAACSELEKPVTTPFYSETQPPPKQEFRWSNGKLPKSLDPAFAAAPPETDIVRALYEGLTEIDPVTMQEVPGVAESWTATEDHRNWTFHLRENARWTNGKPVTAFDFVRSWQRLAALGKNAAHHELAANIMGFPIERGENTVKDVKFPSPLLSPNPESNGAAAANDLVSPPSLSGSETNTNSNVSPQKERSTAAFGVAAADARTLNVSLQLPDKDFPKLVAHPIFRPVFEPGNLSERLDSNIVTNGPFRIAAVSPDGISLERSDTYWNRSNVKLERVRFVPMDNAESALQAYRSGELDAVTNAEFSPLALKLLEPYADFRRTTHSALNFYEVNYRKPPFNDRRVREALAIAVERERLTEGELEGSTRPALQFVPFGKTTTALVQDKARARSLLEEAGYADGENFPIIRLVVNRNDTQQRVARAVAKMWKQTLNLETEIIVKEPDELDAARKAGDFDLIRRNVVLPTPDETVGFLAIFQAEGVPAVDVPAKTAPEQSRNYSAAESDQSVEPEPQLAENVAKDMILSEEDALYKLHAIPLYFPTSYSLVKPYVSGFEMNGLDAPLLNTVTIDNAWQPKTGGSESK